MSAELVSLIQNLAVASGMVALTVLTHFWGFILLTYLMRRGGKRLRPQESRSGQAMLILLVVFGIFGLHTLEIWFYAALYLLLGEARLLEEALYFSTVTFASLGFGDIVLSPKWRLLSAIEAANGVILFAWSTTFLLGVNTRLRLLEHDWLEHRDKEPASE
ncbi:MAG: potassium channel family protein [Hyphomonadaceae bacterium]